ncbi:hypothetical protein KSP39_PZI020383 [Platanthera zijinensis]|uniref:Uncharacterized protein n=1 Tax=Platanthera zijinensis TaxID=2320716 RepID=A0AAP0B0F6_9ASPA
MEVVAPMPDFHFNASTPSSPPALFSTSSGFDFHHQRHISAPNSPTAAAAIYAFLRETAANSRGGCQSSFPFDWEEKQSIPKSYDDEKDVNLDFDFAIGFSGRHLAKTVPSPQATVTSADELFELGMIRPLKLPPRLYTPVMGEQSPKSPRDGRGLLSPLRRGRNQCRKELDPFAVAMAEATRSRKDSRSLSPFTGRGGEFYTPKSSPPRLHPAMAKGGRGWKLKLKDFFLFRSSSEEQTAGEGKNNDLCKNGSSPSSSTPSSSPTSSIAQRNAKKGLGGGFAGEESRCSSFRSTESGSSRQGEVTPECTEKTEADMKKKVTPSRQSKFSIRSIAGSKFAGTFIRRRS